MAGVVLARAESKVFAGAVLVTFLSLLLSGYVLVGSDSIAKKRYLRILPIVYYCTVVLLFSSCFYGAAQRAYCALISYSGR